MTGPVLLSDSRFARSGSYAAYFPGVNTFGTLTQTLTTAPVGLYNLSFYLSNNADPLNEFRASFGGTQLLDIVDVNAFGYTLESFNNVAATGASTDLTFTAFQNPGSFYLDDITVTFAGTSAVPEPGSVALLAGLGASGIGLLLCRRRKA